MAFTLNDVVHLKPKEIKMQKSFPSKRPAIVVGGSRLKKDDQKEELVPEAARSRPVELIPFTINDIMSRPTQGLAAISSPSSGDVIQQTGTSQATKFANSSSIESVGSEPERQAGLPTHFNPVQTIDLVGSSQLGTRPVRKAQHPSLAR